MSPEPTLWEQLDAALTFDDDLHVTLGEVSRRMEGREVGILLLLVGVPFLIPVPTPGLSTPFGLALSVIGIRYLWGTDLHLPKIIRDHRLSPKAIRTFRKSIVGACRKIEWMVRPRMEHMLHGRGRLIVGISIVSASLAMAVPGPASNVVPAISLISIALGILAKDGVFLIVGAIASALSWIYVGLIGLLVYHGWKYVQIWLA